VSVTTCRACSRCSTCCGGSSVGAALLSLPLASVGAAVSSLTSRRVVATAIIAVIMLLCTAVTAVLSETGSPDSIRLLDVVSVAFEMPYRLLLLGSEGGSDLSSVPAWQLLTAWTGWVLLPAAVVVASYATTKVSR
jgi:hypothetical protein